MRKLLPLALSALLLTGCAADSAAGPAELNCERYETGTAVTQISVDPTPGTQPEALFPTPLTGTGVETAVLFEGSGPEIVGNQRIRIQFAGYNAATGEPFQASDFGSGPSLPQDLRLGEEPDFCKALTGVKIGSRVAILLSPEAAHQNQGVPGIGIAENDGVIFIFDVIEGYLSRATGVTKSAQAGFPTVILAPNGQPGIQTLNSAAPTEFKRSILIEGTGPEIAIGDTAVLHYTGWTWQGNEFDSSWKRNTAAEFSVSSGSLIEGFVMGLDGVKVGSQVVIVIPPDLGYGDSATGSIPANSTLVFVVDVLGKVGQGVN